MPKPKSGDETPSTFTSKWSYFKILWFLKDQMIPKQLSGNLPIDDNLTQTEEDAVYLEDLLADEDAAHTPIETAEAEPEVFGNNNQSTSSTTSAQSSRQTEVANCTAPPKRPVKRAAKGKETFDIDRFLMLEQEKLDILRQRANTASSAQSGIIQDDDFHFLMSFHKPLQNMRLETKMWFRFKMQELLYNATMSDIRFENSTIQNQQAQEDQPLVATPLVSPYSTDTNNSFTNL